MRKTIFIACFILSIASISHAQEESLPVDSTVASSVNPTDTTSSEATTDAMLINENPIIHMLPHHFNMNIGGGIHTMMTNPEQGNWHLGYGGLFEMKYLYIPKHVGLSIGGKVTFRNGSTTADLQYQMKRQHLENGQMCTFTTTVQGWKEQESMWAVEVPFQMVIASNTTKRNNFIAALGVAATMPIVGKYKVKEGQITTSGYFEQTKVEMYDMPEKGFGTIQADNIKKDKINYSRFGLNGILDLGLLHNFTNEAGLYIGIYGSYGILNAYKASEKELYEYGNSNSIFSNGFDYSGIYNSKFISQITPIEAGVKIGLFVNYHDIDREINDKNKALSERVNQERQAAEEAAAERAAKAAEKNRMQELEKEKQERIQQELRGIQEASRWEATQALKAIKDAARYANINATPTFPASVDPEFITLLKYLDSNSDAKIIITGHTDNSGTPAKNIVNGQHRAEAFKTALVKKNIPRARIGCVSKGETEPIGDNETVEGRAMNNRVELDLVDQTSAIMNNINEMTPMDEETE